MKSNAWGIALITITFAPVLLRLTYSYEAWYIYAMKMLVDSAYISFAWLIASGFRQSIVRTILDQSLHGKFHNYLGYIALVGILIHPFGFVFLWSDWGLLVPFGHDYGFLITVGALALIVGIITGISSYFIRKRYYDLWSIVHYLNYLFFVMIFAHAWSSLPLNTPTGWYYIFIFVVTVGMMLYKFMFDLRMLSFKVPITYFEQVATDTYTVRFDVPGDRIQAWQPGQYVMVTIDQTDDHHPFSISRIFTEASGEELSGQAEITFKVFGNFTEKFSGLQKGDQIYLAGPYGSANKMVEYRKHDLVFIAGGIGITPFRAMIHQLLESGDRRNLYLFYCVSDIGYFAFDEELQQLANRYQNFEYIKMCARPTEDEAILEGYISDTIIQERVGDLAKQSYVVCGPDAMLAAVNVMLRFNNVPRYQIHKEEFSYWQPGLAAVQLLPWAPPLCGILIMKHTSQLATKQDIAQTREELSTEIKSTEAKIDELVRIVKIGFDDMGTRLDTMSQDVELIKLRLGEKADRFEVADLNRRVSSIETHLNLA